MRKCLNLIVLLLLCGEGFVLWIQKFLSIKIWLFFSDLLQVSGDEWPYNIVIFISEIVYSNAKKKTKPRAFPSDKYKHQNCFLHAQNTVSTDSENQIFQLPCSRILPTPKKVILLNRVHLFYCAVTFNIPPDMSALDNIQPIEAINYFVEMEVERHLEKLRQAAAKEQSKKEDDKKNTVLVLPKIRRLVIKLKPFESCLRTVSACVVAYWHVWNEIIWMIELLLGCGETCFPRIHWYHRVPVMFIWNQQEGCYRLQVMISLLPLRIFIRYNKVCLITRHLFIGCIWDLCLHEVCLPGYYMDSISPTFTRKKYNAKKHFCFLW